MSYQQNVAAAAAALKRGEDANWELARLTYESTLDRGERNPDKVRMAQWSADVRAESGRRFSEKTGERYKRIWRLYPHPQADNRPSWTDAWLEAEGYTAAEHDAIRTHSEIRRAAPETKLRVARDLLADPDVTADPDVQKRIADQVRHSSPEMKANVARDMLEDLETRQRLARDPKLRDTVSAQRALEYDQRQPPADPDRERAVNDFDRRLDSAVAEMGVSAMRLVGDWQWLVERLRVINEGHGRLPDDVYDALIDVTRQAALELRFYAAMHSLPEPDFQRAERTRP